MTWPNLVREYLPDLPESEINRVLWDLTSYPFGSEPQVRTHLAECRDMGVEAYAAHSVAEMDRVMAEWSAAHPLDPETGWPVEEAGA